MEHGQHARRVTGQQPGAAEEHTMRTTAIVAAVAVITVSGIAVGGAIASPRTGEDAVEPVRVGALEMEDRATPSPSASASDSASASPSASPRTVQGLDEVTGTLAFQSDDVDEFEVGGVELELGPEEWLAVATSPADLDGDGSIDTVLVELTALVGTDVTVQGRLDDKGEDLEVYRVNGLAYREVSGGPAPWERGDGTVASRERIEEAALEAVGPGARILTLDDEDDDGASWEAEVLGTDGREYRVLLDASGVVLDVRSEAPTPSPTTSTTPAATRTTEAGDDNGGDRPDGVSDDGPGDDNGGDRADDDSDDSDDDSGRGRGRGGDDDSDDRDDD
jgi:uncharacterized membrane protein YkoI